MMLARVLAGEEADGEEGGSLPPLPSRVQVVHEGQEPLNFAAAFGVWFVDERGAAAAFVDPRLAYLESRDQGGARDKAAADMRAGISACLQAGCCTVGVTGTGDLPVIVELRQCIDCYGENAARYGVCASCAKACHSGCTVTGPVLGSIHCACGAGDVATVSPCLCLESVTP